ncbi:MAG TPA: VOC family protein [Polyangia bacterium]|nr:VOC family protein [Polyangia bacterium]
MSSQKPTTGFEGVTPILRVADLTASIDYFVRKLGFSLTWRTDLLADVGRGPCHLFLSQGDQGAGRLWLWIGVEDADALYEEYRASGATIRHPPANYAWAYEMQVEDLDGNVLRMGSEPKPGAPIGEWLDDNGRRWRYDDEGQWRRMDGA